MTDIEIRELDDLIWCSIENISEFDLEGLCKDRKDNDKEKKPLIVLTHNNKKIKQIDIYADSGEKLEDIANSRFGDNRPLVNLMSSEYSHQLAITSDKNDSNAFNSYLTKAFSILLITGRPLRYYNCTFFLPLDLILDSELGMESTNPTFKVKTSDSIERFIVTPPSSLLDKHKGKTNNFNPKEEDDIAHAQAQEFFYSHIQDLLFETTKNTGTQTSIIHHRIKHSQLKETKLQLLKNNDESVEVEAQLEDVSLYEYYNGLFLLGIRVGLPENTLHQTINSVCWIEWKDKKDKSNPKYKEYLKKKQLREQLQDTSPNFKILCSDTNWWEPLVFGSTEDYESIKKLQVEDWLRFTKTVRVLYANFFEQLTENKVSPVALKNFKSNIIKSNVKEEFSSVILELIKHFIDIDQTELNRHQRLKQISDERMFAHASYVLAGETAPTGSIEQQEFKRLFSYALYVDQRTDGYDKANAWTYDSQYIQKLMETQMICRWESISSLSGFTDYSSIFMGYGGYFQQPISSVHVPYIYSKIQIQVLFYRLTLELFDRCIDNATDSLKKNGVKSQDFMKLNKSLIEFTNKHWFRDLTPQIQGKEIAMLMLKQQQLDRKYELIKDKLERASDYSTTLKDFWLQEKAIFIGWGATAFAALTFVPQIINSFFDKSVNSEGSIIVFIGILISAIVYLLKTMK